MRGRFALVGTLQPSRGGEIATATLIARVEAAAQGVGPETVHLRPGSHDGHMRWLGLLAVALLAPGVALGFRHPFSR